MCKVKWMWRATALCLVFGVHDAGPGRAQETFIYDVRDQSVYSAASVGGTPAQLKDYFAEGTVTVGGIQMKVVGGTLLDGKPVLWVRAGDLSRKRLVVPIPEHSFPRLPTKNEGVGILAGSSMAGVRFSDALFMSPSPRKGGVTEGGAPPFFFYLSPLSGATWTEDKDTPLEKRLVPRVQEMAIKAMLPDLYAYQALDKTGKVAYTRRPYFVASTSGTISKEDVVRIEEIELPERTQVGKGIFINKVVIALQGLEEVDQFPNKLGKPLALGYGRELGDAQEWYVENGEGVKSRLLRQDVVSSGSATAVYENGISLPVDSLLRIFRYSEAVTKPGATE